MDQIEKLYGVCDGLNNKFSGNKNPYMILSRLLEESGELASAVHHIEKRGRKIEKHGEPDKENLTKEVFDVLTSVLSISRYYQIEIDLKNKISKHYEMVMDEGLI